MAVAENGPIDKPVAFAYGIPAGLGVHTHTRTDRPGTTGVVRRFVQAARDERRHRQHADDDLGAAREVAAYLQFHDAAHARMTLALAAPRLAAGRVPGPRQT